MTQEAELADVLALPDHLRDAVWRIESARLHAMEAPMALVGGMGGSAVGGDLAAAALGDRLTKPLLTVRGYELPSWAPAGSAVLCSSYSGDSEETLAIYEAGEALGAQRLVATTGGRLAELARGDGVPVVGLPAGLQPRAAVGYTFAVAAELAALALAAPRIHTELDAAASQLERRREPLRERAGTIATELEGTVPVVLGSDLSAPVAYRWKTQINEHAKLLAFSSVLPEADHNEVVGWDGAPDVSGFSCVMLGDADLHPRERQRFELTAKLLERSGARVLAAEAQGESRTARLLELVMLGDLVALELARRRGVDPTPVEAIERLKSELGRP